MISIALGGQMGNQMFQVAFGHVASRRLDTSLSLTAEPSRQLIESFELAEWVEPWVRARRNAAFRARHLRRGSVTVENRRDDPDSVLANLRDGVHYSGFFQSERYFAGYEDEVRRLFTLRARARDEFVRRYGDLGSYAAVHVRRRDYLETPWFLPAGFYRDALETAGEIAGLPVLVVSDDIDSVRHELRDLPGARFESNPAIVDLQLLMNADVVVASASSFSWWGAWLNRRPALRVVAPQHWLGFSRGVEEPLGVLPERWLQVPVREARAAPATAGA